MTQEQIEMLKGMFAELKTLPIDKQVEAKEQILTYVEEAVA